jgi:hypothetical protein
MKIIASLLLSASLIFAVNAADAGANKDSKVHAPKGKICFKIKNDTGKSQTLHTGSGTKVINNLTTNEICIDEGGKLYLAERGSKGKVLLEIKSGISGKTFELSKLM